MTTVDVSPGTGTTSVQVWQPLEIVLQATAGYGNPYVEVAVDRDNVTGIDWGVYGAPETFIVDADGIIRYKHVGPITPDIWTREFMPRIAQAKEPM